MPPLPLGKHEYCALPGTRTETSFEVMDCSRAVALSPSTQISPMEFTCGVTPYTGYPCFSAPVSLAAEARRSGIDLFETANNHICDKGSRGLDSTISIYSRNGWDYTGIYRNDVEEYVNDPAIYELKGVRIAFINMTYGTNGNKIPEPYSVNLLDTADVAASIRRAQDRDAELIVALPHWGTEYKTSPSDSQKRWEKFLYSHGVDIIIGSHPHVVEPIVALTDPASGKIKHITAFSLGNYISNMSIKYGRIGALAMIRIVKVHELAKDMAVPPFNVFPRSSQSSFLGMVQPTGQTPLGPPARPEPTCPPVASFQL